MPKREKAAGKGYGSIADIGNAAVRKVWRKESIGGMKKFLLIIVLALSMGVYGCSVKPDELLWGKGRRETEYAIASSTRRYLTEKYGNFYYDVVGLFTAGWTYNYDLLNLSVEIDGVDESFSVERHKTETGYEFKDNYFGLLVRPSFEEKVSKLAAEYFDEFHVYASLEAKYPNNFTKPAQLDELLAIDNLDGLEDIFVVVIVENRFSNMEEFETVAKSFVDRWSEEKVLSTVRVICVSEEVYQTIDRSNVSSVYVNNKLAEYNDTLRF